MPASSGYPAMSHVFAKRTCQNCVISLPMHGSDQQSQARWYTDGCREAPTSQRTRRFTHLPQDPQLSLALANIAPPPLLLVVFAVGLPPPAQRLLLTEGLTITLIRLALAHAPPPQKTRVPQPLLLRAGVPSGWRNRTLLHWLTALPQSHGTPCWRTWT